MRGGWGLDLAVPNLGEWRRLVRSRAGESHAVVFDGPIPPKCAGACGPAALGGGRLQEFRHLLRAENFGAPPVFIRCTNPDIGLCFYFFEEMPSAGDAGVSWAAHRWHLPSFGGDVLCYILA